MFGSDILETLTKLKNFPQRPIQVYVYILKGSKILYKISNFKNKQKEILLL